MKKIAFTKMHGIGNDYIYINCFAEQVCSPNKLSLKMSPRHFSVGADGVVLICPSERADARMRMFNADGSEGKMCGNAIRCVGKYLYDNGMVTKDEITVETLSGIKKLQLHLENGKVQGATVAMGKADFSPAAIPLSPSLSSSSFSLSVGGSDWHMTCVSVGNPHAVTYVADPGRLNLADIGPLFEYNGAFPERVNTEFVRVIDPTTLEMRVWERGSGETFACGTGACAVTAASVKNGFCPADTPITVRLLGGELSIVCTHDYELFMTGSAVKVYEGIYEYDED